MDQAVFTALGQLFDPRSPARLDPYPAYATLREHAAALRTPFSVILTRYEPVDRAMRSSKLRTPRGWREANDPAGPQRFDPDGVLTRHRKQWLLFQSGERHARLRKLLAKVFTPRAVRGLAPRIDGLVDQMVGAAVERGRMDVIDDLAYPLPATVICELLGVPEADRERNRQWAHAILPTTEPITSPAQNAAAEAAMTEWDAYIRALMAERRARPQGALLDDMLAVEDDGERFSDDEIAGNVSFLFAAGHETTTNLIGNGLLALILHPEEMTRLRAEPGLAERAVEELLRYDPPVQFTARVSDEPIELEGIEVKPGEIVSCALAAANRDPRRFADPDRLDLTRDAKPLSFGAGAHHCLGAALARAEGQAALSALVSRTSSIELDGEWKFRPNLALRGLDRFHVTLHPQ